MVAERFEVLRLVCPEAILSYCSAARVHGLPGPEGVRARRPLLTTVSRIRRRGLIAHRGRRRTAVVRGIPVIGLAETWADLAPLRRAR